MIFFYLWPMVYMVLVACGIGGHKNECKGNVLVAIKMNVKEMCL